MCRSEIKSQKILACILSLGQVSAASAWPRVDLSTELKPDKLSLRKPGQG